MTEVIERLRDILGQQYEIERELPGGGMSRVFLAREVSLDRPNCSTRTWCRC